MGKRYQAILKWLGQNVICQDLNKHCNLKDSEIEAEIDEIIIASPTPTHADLIKHYLKFEKPILCEKPICTDIKELNSLLKEISEADIYFDMMMQYEWIPKSRVRNQPSSYDYFRHGNDGLIWDCMQVIAFAEGPVNLAEVSPIWRCTINGEDLRIADMDLAYVKAVSHFINGGFAKSLERLSEIHEKVANFKND